MPIWYIDNNRGSAGNDGLSANSPKKDLSWITDTTTATAGDAFLLADDSHWFLTPNTRVIPSTSWSGAKNKPVIIGKYSPSSQSIGQRPLITMHANTVPGDWAYVPSLNGWAYNYPTAHLSLLAMVRLGNSWNSPDASMLGNPTDTPVETVDGRYTIRLSGGVVDGVTLLPSNQTLILYAPAGINPITYYGKVVVGPMATGAISLSANRKHVTVQDLGFLETACGVSMFSSTSDVADYVVQRCRSDIGGIAAVVGSSGGNLRARVVDCEAYDFGATAIHCQASAGLVSAEVARNKLVGGGWNSSQGSIYIQTRNAARDTICVVRNNNVSRYRWGVRGKSFDGCGIYCETGSDGVLFQNNVVHDQYVAFQDNSGRRNYWIGNLAYNVRRGIRITDDANNSNGDVRLYNNTMIVGDPNQNTEFGNTIQGAEFPGIWAFDGTAIVVTAKNNIIANVGGQFGLAWCGLPSAGSPSTYDLNNNWVFGFQNDTHNTFPVAPLASPPTVTNAGTTDPRPFLDAGYTLKVPGGTNLSSLATANPLALAGTYIQGVTLRNGRMRPGYCPVGAYQAVLPRTERA
jgi:hypothetical protein